MTPHQAVCHLSDSIKAILGDRPIGHHPISFARRLKRFYAFTLPLPWPRGSVRTSPEVDAERGGTPPGDFAKDVAELRSLLARFAATRPETLLPHYAWGNMGAGALGRYGYRHMAHHLTQFGV
jgi:hypothetical protein